MPLRACAHPTCSKYIRDGRYCADHREQGRTARAESQRFYDQHARDDDAKRFYNSAAWLAVRKAVLATFPICQRCLEAWAKSVHHVIPLKKCTPEQALDPANLKALCTPCHNIVEAEAAAAERATA